MMSLVYIFAINACLAIDGDTLKCGNERVRLARIDAPEIHGPHPMLAQQAKNRLATLIVNSNVYCVVDHRREKWGRLLGDCSSDKSRSFSNTMLEEGLAVPYEGGHRVPY